VLRLEEGVEVALVALDGGDGEGVQMAVVAA